MDVRALRDLGGIVLQASAPRPLFQEVTQQGPLPLSTSASGRLYRLFIQQLLLAAQGAHSCEQAGVASALREPWPGFLTRLASPIPSGVSVCG